VAVFILGVSWLIWYLLFAGSDNGIFRDRRIGQIGIIVAVIAVPLSMGIETALVRTSIASFCAENGIVYADHSVMSHGGGRAVPLWCRKVTLIDHRNVHRVVMVGDPFWGMLNPRVRVVQEYPVK
jgi:hypothetical protein